VADTIETLLYLEARCRLAESGGDWDVASGERIITLHEMLRRAEQLADGVCKEKGIKHSPSVQRLIRRYLEAKEETK
jgi:hypothetical protein